MKGGDMNCEQAQEGLLRSVDGETPSPEAAAHVAACGECSAYAERLRRLDEAVRGLRVPDSAAAREAFLRRVGADHRAGQDQSRSIFRIVPRPIWSIAALLLIAFGVAAWLMPAGEDAANIEASAAVLDSTVDWNLQLADIRSLEQRSQLYVEGSRKLKTNMGKARLRSEDRELTEKLLENGSWLARNVDPLLEAERFSDVEEILARRLRDAAAKGDVQKVKRLSRLYARVAQQGVHPNLDRAEKAGPMTGERRNKLNRVLKRGQESGRVLASAVERAPAPAKDDVRRALDASKRRLKDRPTTDRARPRNRE